MVTGRKVQGTGQQNAPSKNLNYKACCNKIFFKPLFKLNFGLNPSLLILLISGIRTSVPPLAKGVFFRMIFFLKILDNLKAKSLILIFS